MKVYSAANGDSGYRVYLDGAEIDKVIEASEDGRYLIRYRTDERGDFVLNAKQTEILTERMCGTVVVLPVELVGQ